jgi:hypothetical protein
LPSVSGFEDGKSAGVFERLPAGFEGIPVEDYGDSLVIPGLVDLHLHAPQYGYRALGMDLELLDWLNINTFPQEEDMRLFPTQKGLPDFYGGFGKRRDDTRLLYSRQDHVRRQSF